MTHNAFLEDLAARRAAQLAADNEGTISGQWDEDEERIVCHGHCNKVHPDLREHYPNGWPLLQKETVDEVLEALGLAVALVPKGVVELTAEQLGFTVEALEYHYDGCDAELHQRNLRIAAPLSAWERLKQGETELIEAPSLDEHPDYPVDVWKDDVEHDQTRLSYREWVNEQVRGETN